MRHRRRYHHRQSHAAITVLKLRKLFEALQNHRGMSNALRKGDASFREPLERLQGEIHGL